MRSGFIARPDSMRTNGHSNFNNLGKRQFVQKDLRRQHRRTDLAEQDVLLRESAETRGIRDPDGEPASLHGSARQGLLRYVAGGRNRPAGQTAPRWTRGAILFRDYRSARITSLRRSAETRTGQTIQEAIGETPLPNNFAGGDGLNTAYYTWTAPVKEKQQAQYDSHRLQIY